MNVTDTIVVTWSRITPESHTTPADVASATFDFILEALSQIRGIKADNVQVIKLQSMQRVLIVSPSRSISSLLDTYLKTSAEDNFLLRDIHLSFSFSLKDTNEHLNHTLKADSEGKLGSPISTHLAVPEHTKLFLVSPPQSPTSEFDFSKVEDSPNKHPHPHIPLDFATNERAQKRVREEAQDKDFVGYVHQDKELLSSCLPFSPISKSTPDIQEPVRIVLTRELKKFKDGTVESTQSYDASENKIAQEIQRLHSSSQPSQSSNTVTVRGIARTAAPPRSIFEDDEDLIAYPDDY
ncbi:hypothetical protein ACO0QE_000392 [Hanseniaspora vineae]